MSGEERLPRRLRAALRCGLDAVVLEDRFDRVPGDVVAEVLQPAADARVAPGRILVRHADDERGDVRLGARATGASRLRTVVLLGDEPPVPPQDRVGCHDAGDGREATTAEDVAFHGEAASLVVGQAQPSGTVRGAEDPVLLEQVVNDRLLLSIDPAGEQQEEEGERGRQRVHGGSLPQMHRGAKRSVSYQFVGERIPAPPLSAALFWNLASAGFSHRTMDLVGRIRRRPRLGGVLELLRARGMIGRLGGALGQYALVAWCFVRP